MTTREFRDPTSAHSESERRPWRQEGQNKDVLAIGLTGGIGAGKSTALALFGEEGAITMSADRLVHDLYAQPQLAARISERFGPEMLNDHGKVDRVRLAKAVQGRRRELGWLEKLIHPLVEEDIEHRIAGAPAGTVVVSEVPLLFESGFQHLFDLVVTVEAGEETRRLRSTHGFDLDMFSELEDRQASSERRMAGSDRFFFNDGDQERLRDWVAGVHREALDLLEERR